MNNEELAAAIHGGQDEFIEQLWEQCNRFIRLRASSYIDYWKPSGVEVDDLYQCGYFALYRAVNTFDPERGAFITLLAQTLKNEFRAACGIRTSKRDPLNSAISLDAPVKYDDDGSTLLDTVADTSDPILDAEERLFQEQLKAAVRGAVSHLPEPPRKAIEAYYFQGMNYQEIADEEHSDPAVIKSRISAALKRMKISPDSPALKEILYGSRNYYKGTSLVTWKRTGTSIEERELLHKERMNQLYNLNSKSGRIAYYVKELDYTWEQAYKQVELHSNDLVIT